MTDDNIQQVTITKQEREGLKMMLNAATKLVDKAMSMYEPPNKCQVVYDWLKGRSMCKNFMKRAGL